MQANNQDGKVWVTRISFQKSAYLCIMTGVKCLNCMITIDVYNNPLGSLLFRWPWFAVGASSKGNGIKQGSEIELFSLMGETQKG